MCTQRPEDILGCPSREGLSLDLELDWQAGSLVDPFDSVTHSPELTAQSSYQVFCVCVCVVLGFHTQALMFASLPTHFIF